MMPGGVRHRSRRTPGPHTAKPEESTARRAHACVGATGLYGRNQASGDIKAASPRGLLLFLAKLIKICERGMLQIRETGWVHFGERCIARRHASWSPRRRSAILVMANDRDSVGQAMHLKPATRQGVKLRAPPNRVDVAGSALRPMRIGRSAEMACYAATRATASGWSE